MRHINADTTSLSINVFIQDSSSTTGAGLTGLAYNTGSLVASYVRAGGSRTAITLATLAAANSAWSSGGFKEIDSTNMPGWYRFDVPDAVLAAGVTEAGVTIHGAANMAPLSIGFVLQQPKVDVTKVLGSAPTTTPTPQEFTSTGTPTTIEIKCSSSGLPTEANAFLNMFVVMTSGTYRNVARQITASSVSGGTMTLATDAFPGAPTVGDTFVIVGKLEV